MTFTCKNEYEMKNISPNYSIYFLISYNLSKGSSLKDQIFKIKGSHAN